MFTIQWYNCFGFSVSVPGWRSHGQHVASYRNEIARATQVLGVAAGPTSSWVHGSIPTSSASATPWPHLHLLLTDHFSPPSRLGHFLWPNAVAIHCESFGCARPDWLPAFAKFSFLTRRRLASPSPSQIHHWCQEGHIAVWSWKVRVVEWVGCWRGGIMLFTCCICLCITLILHPINIRIPRWLTPCGFDSLMWDVLPSYRAFADRFGSELNQLLRKPSVDCGILYCKTDTEEAWLLHGGLWASLCWSFLLVRDSCIH